MTGSEKEDIDEMPYPIRMKFLAESNFLPNESEINEINRIISVRTSHLAALDEELAAARALVQRLEPQRSECANEILKCKAIISPIRRVPPEILREIFLEIFFLERSFYSYRAPPSYRVPLLLGQICSIWRQVCVEFPQLWQHISISFGETDHDLLMELAKTFLDRAQDLPLSLNLRPAPKTSANNLANMMSVLLPYFPQCKRLYLHLSAVFIPALSTTLHSMGFLEHLELTFTESLTSERFVWTTTLTAFQDAPRLKSVELLSHYPVGESEIQKLNLPWSQLTHLEIQNYDFDPRDTVLFSQCLNLEQCTLTERFEEDSDRLPESVVAPPQTILPRLRDLHLIDRNSPILLVDVLDTLTVPNLCTLALEGDDEQRYEDFPKTKFISLQDRSQFALTSLSVTRLSMEGDFTSFFRAMPFLVSFSAKSCMCRNTMVGALVAREDSNPLLPCLEVLIIAHLEDDDDFNNYQRFDSEDVGAMVGSRWWSDTDLHVRPVARLRKVRLQVEIGVTPASDPTLEMLTAKWREGGLDIEVELLG